MSILINGFVISIIILQVVNCRGFPDVRWSDGQPLSDKSELVYREQSPLLETIGISGVS